MHTKVTFIFILTLGLYLITLFTVPYVGVYLTYGAVPVIVITGFISYLTRPKDEPVPISTYERIKKLEQEIIDIDNRK